MLYGLIQLHLEQPKLQSFDRSCVMGLRCLGTALCCFIILTEGKKLFQPLCTKVQYAIVITLRLAWVLVPHFKGLKQGKAVSDKLFCMLTDLVYVLVCCHRHLSSFKISITLNRQNLNHEEAKSFNH